MNTKMVVVLIIAISFALGSYVLYAGCGACGGGGSACGIVGSDAEAGTALQGVTNSVCPVLGEAVSADTKYTAVYGGRKIGFCCAGCVKKFTQNPEKYIGNI